MSFPRSLSQSSNHALPIYGSRGQQVSPGHFVGHGSAERRYRSRDSAGARAGSRRVVSPSSRSIPTSAGDRAEVRSGPAGEQERVEWLDALRDVEQRVRTVEGQQRTCAQSIATLELALSHQARAYTDMDEDIRNYKDYVEKTLRHNPDSVAKSFVNLNNQLEGHINNMAELTAMQLSNDHSLQCRIEQIEQSMATQDLPGAVPGIIVNEIPNFPINTPVGDPWQDRPDPWATAGAPSPQQVGPPASCFMSTGPRVASQAHRIWTC